MPSVRKLAREKGIDIGSIEGSGRGGKITREDVLNPTESDQNNKQEQTETKTNHLGLAQIRMKNGLRCLA